MMLVMMKVLMMKWYDECYSDDEVYYNDSIDDGDDVYDTVLANYENVDATNDAMIMMTIMIMIMSKMMKTMMIMGEHLWWRWVPLVIATEGVKLLMSNDKMMTLIIMMTPAIIMMNYTVQVGGAGCEGAAQLRYCVYRGGGKEARPKEHPAR